MRALTCLSFILILGISPGSSAQRSTISNSNTTLFTSVDPYHSLPRPTLVNEKNPRYLSGSFAIVYESIPIGFEFELDGVLYDTLQPAKDGFVVFYDGRTPRNWISVFEAGLTNYRLEPDSSPIQYSLTGVPGNRIFKLEYQKVGFLGDFEYDDYVNFQLWIYENCGNFEVRIGEYSINSDVFRKGAPAPYIGYGRYGSALTILTYLSGHPESPVLVDEIATMNSMPDAGSVYTFSKCIVGEEEWDNVPVSEVYPNPVQSTTHIRLKNIYNNVEVQLLNLQGQEMKSAAYRYTDQILLDMEDVPAGLYLLNLVTPSGSQQVKLLKN